MTAVPKDTSLGLTRCTCTLGPQNAPATRLPNREKKPATETAAFFEPWPMATPPSAAAPHGVGLVAASVEGGGSGGATGESAAVAAWRVSRANDGAELGMSVGA